jgi:hypothetical protein
MPLENINYANTIIYKIVCNDLNVPYMYIGSTTNLKTRTYQHKHSCVCPDNKNYNSKPYTVLRQYGGWSNWSLIVIEKFPCEDVHDARARERHWYELLSPVLNSRKPIARENEHKNSLKFHNNIRHECECGGSFLVKHRANHYRTQKHNKFLNERVIV